MKNGSNESLELAALRQIEKHARSIRHNVGCLTILAILAALLVAGPALLNTVVWVSRPTPPPASSP